MSDDRISVLICNDAGAASMTLLVRDDLRIRWALSVEEALAVLQLTRCTICIARAAMAKPVLTACKVAARDIASIVLLDPAEWSTWREYFNAGATAVLQATGADQLLDALSDATGVSFRSSPRVPFRSEVRIAQDPRTPYNTVNLSSTGLSILDFPLFALGAAIDLLLTIEGRQYPMRAVVSRISRRGERRSVGVAFQDLSPELQARIHEVITVNQIDLFPNTESGVSFDPLDDGTLVALRSSNVQGDTLALMRTLIRYGKVASTESAEPWLIAACDSFSPVEVSAINDPSSVPQWAEDAVMLRLSAYRARARAGSHGPSEADAREVFGLAQRLAESSSGADDASLVKVTNIRADVLRALYDPDLFVMT